MCPNRPSSEEQKRFRRPTSKNQQQNPIIFLEHFSQGSTSVNQARMIENPRQPKQDPTVENEDISVEKTVGAGAETKQFEITEAKAETKQAGITEVKAETKQAGITEAKAEANLAEKLEAKAAITEAIRASAVHLVINKVRSRIEACGIIEVAHEIREVLRATNKVIRRIKEAFLDGTVETIDTREVIVNIRVS